MNSVESEAAARAFLDAGFEVHFSRELPRESERDIALAVVNTCTVTSKAEQKCRRVIRNLLVSYPCAAVLVTGCYAELDAEKIAEIDPRVVVLRGSQKELLADIPAQLKTIFTMHSIAHNKMHGAADKIIAHNAESSCGALDEIIPALRAIIADAARDMSRQFRLSTDTFAAHSRSSLKIQDGCDNKCSYCRIHLARGKARSLAVSEVIERARLLERAGQREVTLTGVNISQYAGAHEEKNIALPALVNLILQNTFSIAVRLSSIHPDCITDELCNALKNPRVRPHVHLSVQSGSDTVLARMNRGYGQKTIVRAVEKLREIKENPFIACDIIAGFPGETEDEFLQTLELCQQCGFAWIHVFPFSPRPGTPAFSMKEKITQSTVKDRAARLTELAVKQKIAFIDSWRGKVLSAIVEHSAEKSRGEKIRAVTENFLHVELPRDAAQEMQCGETQAGTETRVRILYPLEENIRSGDETEAAAEIFLQRDSVFP